MAFIHGDSFDYASTYTDLLTKWTVSDSGVSLVTGRYGGKAVSNLNNNSGPGYTFPTTYTTLIFIGDHERTTGSSNSNLLKFTEGGTTHLDLRHDGTTGFYTVTRNGTVLGTSTHGFSSSTWHNIQLKITISDTVGVVTLKVDSATEINISSQDTRNGLTGVIDGYMLISSGANTAIWDNIAIFDTSGSRNNDFPAAEPRYYSIYPTSETAQIDFTPSTGTDNSLLVDDVPRNDDTDYNSSSTLNALDIFNMGDLTPTSATILAVQSNVLARREDSGTRAIAPVIQIGSNTYVRTATNIGNTYTWCTAIDETNPDTSTDWTLSDVNGMKSGYKITT